jgi:hypothetical protein
VAESQPLAAFQRTTSHSNPFECEKPDLQIGVRSWLSRKTGSHFFAPCSIVDKREDASLRSVRIPAESRDAVVAPIRAARPQTLLF